MNTSPEPIWLTAAQAAAEAQAIVPGAPINQMRVYAWARDGVFPPGVVLRLGRSIRIHRERLRDFLERGGGALPRGWKRGPAA